MLCVLTEEDKYTEIPREEGIQGGAKHLIATSLAGKKKVITW